MTGVFENFKPLKGKAGGDQVPENDAVSQGEFLVREAEDHEGTPEWRAWVRRSTDRMYGEVA